MAKSRKSRKNNKTVPAAPPLEETSIPPEGDQEVSPVTAEEVGVENTTPTPPIADKEEEDPSTQEQPKKSVPKVDKPEDEKPKKAAENVNVPPAPSVVSVDDNHNSLNPEQAVSWAMTQNDPKAAIMRLKRERRLNSVTLTLQALEAAGVEL